MTMKKGFLDRDSTQKWAYIFLGTLTGLLTMPLLMWLMLSLYNMF